ITDSTTRQPSRVQGGSNGMATLDDIATERQRLADRLARVDAERQKLVEQIADLDAAERVLSRLSPTAAPGRRRRRLPPAEAATTAAPRRRGRGGRGQSAAAPEKAPGRRRGAGRSGRRAAKPEVTLGDATLRAVEALGNGVSTDQVREYLGRELGMQVRANHLGRALQRHRTAGRLREEDGRWLVVQPPAGEPS